MTHDDADASPAPRFHRSESGRLCFRGRELPDGPWHAEPDRVEFRHAGLPCLLVRGPMGAWCGYVATPPGHPWRTRDLMLGDDIPDDVPEVHGGVTYMEPCQDDVCHVPAPGESDDVMWVGFDCSHAGDLSLAWMREYLIYGVYRDVAYARRETEQLAAQAAAVGASTGRASS